MESYTCFRKCSGSVGRIIFLLWYEALRRNPAFILSLRQTVFRVRFEMFEHSDAMMWVDVGGGLEMNSIRAFDDWIQIIKELDCVVIRHENEINSAENSFLRLSGLETRFWSFEAAFYGLTVHIKLLMAEFKFASQFRCLCVDIHSFATQIPSFSLCSNINRATRGELNFEARANHKFDRRPRSADETQSLSNRHSEKESHFPHHSVETRPWGLRILTHIFKSNSSDQ